MVSIVAGVLSLKAAPTKIITGPDAGLGPVINTYTYTGASNGSFPAFDASFSGGVRVALANIVGTNDIIAGAGPGGGPLVRVFSGRSHNPIYAFFAYPSNLTHGVFVAGGDINGDGQADIIVGPGDGTGSSPNVKVFSGTDGTTLLANFFAFAANFTGGVRVAGGDVDGDGRADIIAGAGPGSSVVAVFSGKDQTLLKNFFAFPGFTGGVHVAAGDVNGDGFDDIIVGAGDGGAHVKVFSGQDLVELRSFFAFANATGGVRVAATDLNGNRRADIIAATGPGDASRLRAFDDTSQVILADLAPYGTFPAGVFPGAIPRFPAQSLNLSTRANVLTGENVLIAGFIVTGSEQKTVIVRGIGPSSGVTGSLADPTLELYSGNTLLASNNDWKTRRTAASAAGRSGRVDHLRRRMTWNRRSCEHCQRQLLRRLARQWRRHRHRSGGSLRSHSQPGRLPQLANISTRGLVQSGDDVMIGGLILGGGTGAKQDCARFGTFPRAIRIANPLGNPVLGLYNSNGTLLLQNDDWRQNQESEIQAANLAPSNDLEAALVALLGPGNYTAIVNGSGGTSGVSLVEIYNLQ